MSDDNLSNLSVNVNPKEDESSTTNVAHLDEENDSQSNKLEDKSLNTLNNEDADKLVLNAGGSSLTPQNSSSIASSNPSKIEIMLKAAGNAPILKKKKFLLERSKNVHYIIEWLKKYMKLDPKEQLFLYVNQEFAPSPDAEIGTIYDCFKIGNSVIFHYCTTPAWG